MFRFCSKLSAFGAVLMTVLVSSSFGASQASISQAGLMYVGTLDHKIMIIDEDKEEVVGEIPLTGIARTTALSADQKQLYVINTHLTLEIVDLASRKVVSTIDLGNDRTRPRVGAVAVNFLNAGSTGRFSGLAVDPNGRYLYSTLRVITKDIDEYRIDPPKFVQIDLQDKTISKSFDFPKGFDEGFGFMASYKVSPDGKLLYVFDEDVDIFDLTTLKQIDRIGLSKPPYPGASPYRLAMSDDPYNGTNTVTSVFTSVDPVVHKGTLGLATLDLMTRDVKYSPVGPSLPMMGFLVSPDRKKGYSVMFSGAGANRKTEWWVWDIENHKVIKTAALEARPTFRFGLSSDGKKLYLYGAGSTVEVFDAETLQSRKILYLNKDTTTNLITLARRGDS